MIRMKILQVTSFRVIQNIICLENFEANSIPKHDTTKQFFDSYPPFSLSTQGAMHIRDRTISPFPHVLLQADQEPQLDHPIFDMVLYTFGPIYEYEMIVPINLR